MDYVVTLDGSAYLMHHGTKGMKWGVWNAETKAKYSGDKGAKRFSKDMSKLAKYDSRKERYLVKAEKLSNKINASSKSARNQIRLAKYERKAAKYGLKAGRPYATDFGMAKTTKAAKKAAMYNAKASKIRSGNAKQQGQLIKYQTKQMKAERKIKKLSTKISNEYSKAKVSNVTDQQKALGRKYLNGVLG